LGKFKIIGNTNNKDNSINNNTTVPIKIAVDNKLDDSVKKDNLTKIAVDNKLDDSVKKDNLTALPKNKTVSKKIGPNLTGRIKETDIKENLETKDNLNVKKSIGAKQSKKTGKVQTTKKQPRKLKQPRKIK